MWYNTAVHTSVATIFATVCSLAKAIVMPWKSAIACLLQGCTALHLAAAAGHVAVVETLLLNGADLEARGQDVSCGSLYKTFETL
jgi:hypothetical protein